MVAPVTPRTKLRTQVKPLLRRLGLAAPLIEARSLLTLRSLGLTNSGWRASARAQMALDAEGNPLPWYTYAAINLLDERLPTGVSVFEWGAGQSTLWYSQRASRVVSVEHDAGWAGHVAASAPAHATVLTRSEGGYLAALPEQDERFDLIVVDGVRQLRREGAEMAPQYLTERGVVVWDNVGPKQTAEVMEGVYGPLGFRHLPLVGLAPGVTYLSRTTVFYRDGNLLGL